MGTTFDPRLPGAELVAPGLADLAAGRLTKEAMLVAMASHRLRSLGLSVAPVMIKEPRLRLYALLAAEDPLDAHTRFNALVGRIVSFAGTAENAPAR